MNEFLSSLKADLLDRRVRPVLLLVGVALLAAVAYAAFGGGGSSSPTAPASSVASAAAAATPAGVSVREASADTRQPVAETTNGVAQQRKGILRNPFGAVAGLKAAKTATGASSSSASGKEAPTTSGASSGSGSGSTGGEGKAGSKSGASEAPSTSEEKTSPPKESSKPVKQTVYRVTAKFGIAPAGTPPLSAQLAPYDDLKRQQPLPSTAQPLVVFRGVTAGGKSATFTLVGEAILRGQGTCQPDASQCLAIDLEPGQYEELEYVPPEGTAVVYQLQVVKIAASKATAAAARLAFRGESKAGIQFLRTAGLDALPGMRYSPNKGVLVFAHRPAFVARAHVAAWAASLRG